MWPPLRAILCLDNTPPRPRRLRGERKTITNLVTLAVQNTDYRQPATRRYTCLEVVAELPLWVVVAQEALKIGQQGVE